MTPVPVRTFKPASPAAVAAEYDHRRDVARKQLVAFFGPEGLVGTGAPDVDILDALLEMAVLTLTLLDQNDARFKLMAQSFQSQPKVADACANGRRSIGDVSGPLLVETCKLIKVRQRLREAGLALGATRG